MSNPLTIQFAGGSKSRIDRDDWPALASSTFGTVQEDGQTTGQLIIGQHADGRTLIYVLLDLPTGDTFAAGELARPDASYVESAVWRIAERFSVPTRLAQSCLAQYRQAIKLGEYDG